MVAMALDSSVASLAQVVHLVARQQQRSRGRRLARGAIIGIAIACFCFVAFCCLVLWCCCCRGKKKSTQPTNRQGGGFLSRFTGGGQRGQPPMGQAGYANGPHQEGGYYR